MGKENNGLTERKTKCMSGTGARSKETKNKLIKQLNYLIIQFKVINSEKYYDTENYKPVAQLVECWAVMREVVSSTPVRPTLRVLK